MADRPNDTGMSLNASANTSSTTPLILMSPRELWVAQAVLAAALIVPGLVEGLANGLLAWAVYAEKTLHTRSSGLLALLAVSDAGLGWTNVLAGLSLVLRLTGVWDLGTLFCLRADIGPRLGLQFASNTLMLSLAVDRALVVFRPLAYFNASAKAARRTWAGWGVAAAAFAVAGWANTQAAEDPFGVACTLGLLTVPPGPGAFVGLSQVAMALSILLIYSAAICGSRKAVQQDSTEKVREQRRRFSRSLAFITLLYFCSFVGSIFVMGFIGSLEDPKDKGKLSKLKLLSEILVHLLVPFNQASNPMVFYRRNAEFRVAMRRRLGLGADVDDWAFHSHSHSHASKTNRSRKCDTRF